MAEPIPERAVGVVKGFGLTDWADLSVRKQGSPHRLRCVPSLGFEVNYFGVICINCFWLGPKMGKDEYAL
jgi:hypothetical protein